MLPLESVVLYWVKKERTRTNQIQAKPKIAANTVYLMGFLICNDCSIIAQILLMFELIFYYPQIALINIKQKCFSNLPTLDLLIILT